MDERPENTRTTAPERPRRTNTIIIVIVLLCAAALVTGFVLLRSPGGPTENGETKRTVVAKFAGDGNEVTDRFDVDEGWQIHWETEGKGFRFSIDGEKFDYGTVIKEKRAGSGVTSPVGAGTFRLNVKAKGPWSVQIIQGEPPPDKGD